MPFFRNIITGALLTCGVGLHAQYFNRPVPPGVPPYEFVKYDNSWQGHYMTAPFSLPASAINSDKHAMILDSDGFLVWYMQLNCRFLLNFKYEAALQKYLFINFQGPDESRFVVLDSGFNPVDTFNTIGGILPDLHEFHVSENNSFLVFGTQDSIMDLSGYLFDGVPGSTTTRAIGFVVQEFDEDHNLLFQWNTNDHINPGTTYGHFGYNPNAFGYAHGNSIDEDADGNLLLSFRHLNAVYNINRQSGEVLWVLGGTNSSFSFPNDIGFSGQHDARHLPNGNIALFDNANQAAPPKISRAVEYYLDTLNWVATKVWEYQYDPAFFALAMGSHQTMDDTIEGRWHLVNYGISYRPDPSFVLTDNNGNKISELFFQDSIVNYRAFLANLPLGNVQRPEITCLQSGNSVMLSAPVGYQDYAWSTGESSTSITLAATGTYQVWVNHGAGMLGSEPFVVEDLINACPSSSVSNPTDPDDQVIVAYYDLLGRKIAEPQKPGQGDKIVVVRYKNGKMRLKHY